MPVALRISTEPREVLDRLEIVASEVAPARP
jgi:hypothetical protein